MGCCVGNLELRSMDTLRHTVPLAVPPLHGHSLDVSRGLRAGWILGSSPRRAKRILHVLASHTARAYPHSSQLESDRVSPRGSRIFCLGLRNEHGIFLL